MHFDLHAIQRDLGLKLEAQKATGDPDIDKGNRVPTENNGWRLPGGDDQEAGLDALVHDAIPHHARGADGIE
jgi:hypothetical protein